MWRDVPSTAAARVEQAADECYVAPIGGQRERRVTLAGDALVRPRSAREKSVDDIQANIPKSGNGNGGGAGGERDVDVHPTLDQRGDVLHARFGHGYDEERRAVGEEVPREIFDGYGPEPCDEFVEPAFVDAVSEVIERIHSRRFRRRKRNAATCRRASAESRNPCDFATERAHALGADGAIPLGHRQRPGVPEFHSSGRSLQVHSARYGRKNHRHTPR